MLVMLSHQRGRWASKRWRISSRTFTTVKVERTYNDAIDKLNTLQTPYAVYQARVKAGIKPDASFMEEMRQCLDRIGYSPEHLNRLHIIHVAGTKGKGTTCALADSILNHWRKVNGRPSKIGLFTSPHLVSVRERIKINSEPVSEEMFARYFFEVWDRLEANPTTPPSTPSPQEESSSPTSSPAFNALGVSTLDGKPIYARYLTLMSWHLFLSEGVSAAVYETGIGGQFDATNLVPEPVACGITTLAKDHIFALGDTVEKIAWHKAGIMKPGVPAFAVRDASAPFSREAEGVLVERSVEIGAPLRFLEREGDVLDRITGSKVKLKPDTEFQRDNAGLAVALAEEALKKVDPGNWDSREKLLQWTEAQRVATQQAEEEALRQKSKYTRELASKFRGDNPPPLPLHREFVQGLENVVWRGRCEEKSVFNVRWHLDGAHTLDSLVLAGNWYRGLVEEREKRWFHGQTEHVVKEGQRHRMMRMGQADIKPPPQRVLIFNQQGRTEAVDFLRPFYEATCSPDGRGFVEAIFCTNTTYASGSVKRDFVNHTVDASEVGSLKVQHLFAETWAKLDPRCKVTVVSSIEEAINRVREIGQTNSKKYKTQALVTGSLHLVGGALSILEGGVETL